MSVISGVWSDDSVEDAGYGNGVLTSYSVNYPMINASKVDVYLNGIIQEYTTDYTLDLTLNKVNFVTAPALAQRIQIKYYKK